MPETDTGMLHLDPAIVAQYNPQADITAYELAILLPYMLSKSFTEETWTALGPIQRHLIRRS